MHLVLSIGLSALLLLQPSRPTPGLVPAVPQRAVATASTARTMEWTIDGVKRSAIVYVPADAKTTSAPVVFAFHGHGGNARYAARSFDYQSHWPEAICVYMEGLPTPGRTDPKGEKNGWQNGMGDSGDRDLKFFDAVLARLKGEYKVDATRIYATGHSNGGGFTYLLWAARGELFAAVAPAAAGAKNFAMLQPKPAMHIAGEQDTLVTLEYQQRMMNRVKRLNGCESRGEAWAPECTQYPSKTGTPFVEMIYPGTHMFPRQAPALIVRFFKEHELKK